MGPGLRIFAHETDHPLDDVYGAAEKHFEGAPAAAVPGVAGSVHEGRRGPGIRGSVRGCRLVRNSLGGVPLGLLVPEFRGSVPLLLVVQVFGDSVPGHLAVPALLQLLPRFVEADGETVFLEQGVGEGADFDDPLCVQAELALTVGQVSIDDDVVMEVVGVQMGVADALDVEALQHVYANLVDQKGIEVRVGERLDQVYGRDGLALDGLLLPGLFVIIFEAFKFFGTVYSAVTVPVGAEVGLGGLRAAQHAVDQEGLLVVFGENQGGLLRVAGVGEDVAEAVFEQVGLFGVVSIAEQGRQLIAVDGDGFADGGHG